MGSYLVQIIRDGEVVKEFVPRYFGMPRINSKESATRYAEWFLCHYGLNRDTYRIVFDL